MTQPIQSFKTLLTWVEYYFCIKNFNKDNMG